MPKKKQLGWTNIDHVLSCQFRLIAESFEYTVLFFKPQNVLHLAGLFFFLRMYLLLRQILFIQMWTEDGNLID